MTNRALTRPAPTDPGLLIRACTLDDVDAILSVVHASDIAAVGQPDFTADEVVEVLTSPHHDPRVDSWLAVAADGRVIGWAYVENKTGGPRDLLDVYVHPRLGQSAQAALLERVLVRVMQRARAFGHPEMTARAGAIASEPYWIGLLEAAGFRFVKRYARMHATLTTDQRIPDSPTGITIRPVRGHDDAELRAFYAVLKAAFDDIPDSMSGDYDAYRSTLMALPAISWDEWFVAEVDGELAGVLQSADQGADANEGWIKNLGVAKEHRGKGIGRLLLLTAFATYARKGRTGAGLGVDLTNPTGAYRLYTSVGMEPAYESDVYERTVTAEDQRPR